MTKSKMANRYSPEVRARAVRTVFEHQGSYETQAGAIAAIAPKIGCIPQTLREWIKQAEKDSGLREGVTTDERGGSRGRQKLTLFSMLWNRSFMIGGQFRKAD